MKVETKKDWTISRMNKKLVSKGITIVMTMMMAVTSMNTSALGGITGYYLGDGIPASPACYHHTAYRTGADREAAEYCNK